MLKPETFQKITLWMGIAMLLGIVIIGVIIFNNIEEVKLLNSNVCDLCEKWTGARCVKTGSLSMGNDFKLNFTFINES